MDLSKDFIGRVVFNEDPTFSGRCKINVFGLFEEFSTEQIPWFTPQSSTMFSSEHGGGSLSVPKIGTIVRVRFPFGDLYSGEYSNIQTIDPALIDEIKSDYQNTHVVLYDSEKELLVIYQPMTGYKMYLAGSMIIIDADGSIRLHHRNNSNVIEVNDSDVNIIASGGGAVNISSGATVNLTAETVNVNANSIALGENATAKAVNGDKLIEVLQTMSEVIDTKDPQEPSPLTGKTFEEILSNNVTLI